MADKHPHLPPPPPESYFNTLFIKFLKLMMSLYIFFSDLRLPAPAGRFLALVVRVGGVLIRIGVTLDTETWRQILTVYLVNWDLDNDEWHWEVQLWIEMLFVVLGLYLSHIDDESSYTFHAGPGFRKNGSGFGPDDGDQLYSDILSDLAAFFERAALDKSQAGSDNGHSSDPETASEHGGSDDPGSGSEHPSVSEHQLPSEQTGFDDKLSSDLNHEPETGDTEGQDPSSGNAPVCEDAPVSDHQPSFEIELPSDIELPSEHQITSEQTGSDNGLSSDLDLTIDHEIPSEDEVAPKPDASSENLSVPEHQRSPEHPAMPKPDQPDSDREISPDLISLPEHDTFSEDEVAPVDDPSPSEHHQFTPEPPLVPEQTDPDREFSHDVMSLPEHEIFSHELTTTPELEVSFENALVVESQPAVETESLDGEPVLEHVSTSEQTDSDRELSSHHESASEHGTFTEEESVSEGEDVSSCKHASISENCVAGDWITVDHNAELDIEGSSELTITHNETSSEHVSPDLASEPALESESAELEGNETENQRGVSSDEKNDEKASAAVSQPESQRVEGPGSEVVIPNTNGRSDCEVVPQHNDCLALSNARVRPLSFFFAPPSSSSSSSSSCSPTAATIIPLSQPGSGSDRFALIAPQAMGLRKNQDLNTRPIGEGLTLTHGETLELTAEDLRHIPMPKPSDLREGLRLAEPVVTDAFERRWINDRLGYGLVATKEIRAGEIIIADKLMTMWTPQELSCKTREKLDKVIDKKAKKLGPDWYAAFLNLAHDLVNVNTTGVKGSLWHKYRLPTALNGNTGGVLGPNLAMMNHACVPNCSLRFTNEYPTNEAGEIQWDETPKVGRGIVRACTNIYPGRELNISYMQTHGTANMRQKDTKRRFGFRCQCQACAVPLKLIEDALKKYNRLNGILSDPNNISNRPAFCFQVAATLIDNLESVAMRDVRLINIWVKCAFIAAHHSDLARACCFLSQARELCLVLEGLTGFSQREIENWYKLPQTMPGFGATAWGASSLSDGVTAFKGGVIPKKALFMLGRSTEEYVRMSRYRALSSTELKAEDLNSPLTEPGFKIVDGPESKPAKLVVDAKCPEDMCRAPPGCADCRLAEQLEKEERDRRQRRIQERNERTNQDPECVDPEDDFYDGIRVMYSDELGPVGLLGHGCPQMLGPGLYHSNYPEDNPVQGEPELDSDSEVDAGPGEIKCARHDYNHKDWDHHGYNHKDESQYTACDEVHDEPHDEVQEQEPEKKKKKRRPKKKGKGKAPMVQDVGAEKKPNIVSKGDTAKSDAGYKTDA